MRTATALIAVIALAGCGLASPPSPSVRTSQTPQATCCSPSPAATESATATPGTVVDGVLTVTDADNGRLLSVPLGTRIEVELASGGEQPVYIWSSVRSADTAVITPSGETTHSNGGAQASFTASARGTTTISATADPSCLHAVPACALPSRLWSVGIVVV